MSPEDLKLIGVKSGSNVKAKTAYGEVVVKVKESQAVKNGDDITFTFPLTVGLSTSALAVRL